MFTDLTIISARARSRSQAKISRDLLRLSAVHPRVDVFGLDERYSPEVFMEPAPANDPVFQSIIFSSTSEGLKQQVGTSSGEKQVELVKNNNYGGSPAVGKSVL